ncbi:MAG: FtsX-like permease family protein [Dehalococcoidia bacterium]|jgi:putative ABC transport system permease protein
MKHKFITSTTVKTIFGNLKLALFLAFKSMFRGNKWALVLIIVVMAFSFVNLIFSSAIISGVMATMDNQIVDTMFSNVVVSPKEDRFYIERSSELVPQIQQVSGVAETCVHLNTTGFIEYGWKEKTLPWEKVKSGNWNIDGINPAQEALVTSIGHNMIEGRYLDEDDTDQIILGVEIAGGNQAQSSDFMTLGGVHIGDKVQVTYANEVQREYTIKGIFRAREMMVADHLAFVTRREMVSVLGRSNFSDRASEILVKADKSGIEDSLASQLKALGTDLQVRTFKEYGGAYRSVISTFELIMGIIGGTGLMVAAIVMFIIIYINVLSKKRQIGILRAIGIPHNAVLGSYLIQALFYSLMGILLGWLIIRVVLQPYFIMHPIDLPLGFLSLHIESGSIIGSAAGLTFASLLAGLIPAWTVMRESIIKTLWGV